MLDDINRMRDEKRRLEEKLAAARMEHRRKDAARAAVLRKKAALSSLLAKREEQMKMIRYRVAQQQVQLKDLRASVALKSETITQKRTEVWNINADNVILNMFKLNTHHHIV